MHVVVSRWKLAAIVSNYRQGKTFKEAESFNSELVVRERHLRNIHRRVKLLEIDDDAFLQEGRANQRHEI